MKKKFLALLLGALMVATMLPVGSMAAEAAAGTNILPNGDFESAFTTKNVGTVSGSFPVNVPDAAWSFSDNYRPGEVQGNTYQVSNEEFATPSGTGHSLKIAKERTGSNGNASGSHLTFAFGPDVLDKNDYYKVEYSYNIPEALGAGLQFQAGLWGAEKSTPITAYSASTVQTTETTDGWVTKSFTFQYNGTQTGFLRFGFRYDAAQAVEGATGTGVAYIDNVSLTKIVDRAADSILAADGSFTSLTAISTSDFQSHSSAARGTNWDIVEDPAAEDSGNMVLAQLHNSTPTRSVIKFPFKAGEYTTDDLFKVTFRVYVESATTPEADFTLPLQYRLNNGSTYTGNYGCQQHYGAYLTITPADFNKWHDVVVYMTAVGVADTYTREFVLLNNSSNYVVYLDDIEAVVVNESSIDNAAVMGRCTTSKLQAIKNDDNAFDAFDTTVYSYIVADEDFVKTDVAQPVVCFAPATSGEQALAGVAVYKNEGESRTLMGIKFNAFTASGTAPVLSANDFSLSFELADGDYDVEYFLWNYAGLAPILSAVYDVTEAIVE